MINYDESHKKINYEYMVSKKKCWEARKTVLIEWDYIYNQFVGGRISPWKENVLLDLFWANCIMLIDNYLKMIMV